jgi:hypothetical protein
MVSLRGALGWMDSWPASVPGNQSTVLVVGLEACLEVMNSVDAEGFLRGRIKPYVMEFQSRWDATGLVFGFGCPASRFRVDTFENVLFKCLGGCEVRVSDFLWNGSSKRDMFQIMVTNPQTNRNELGGFYVRHLS